MIFDTVDVEEKIGYTFKDKILLRQCFTHSSYSYENKGSKNNEVLEFFGDAILDYVITEYLFKNIEGDEGILSQKRAGIVSRQPLQDVTFKLRLENYMLVGNGVSVKENSNEKMYSSLFEAVVAGIYLDGGILPTKKFILNNLIGNKQVKKEPQKPKFEAKNELKIDEKKVETLKKEPFKKTEKPIKPIKEIKPIKPLASEKAEDYKSELQELIQKHKLGLIEYNLIEKKGPDHAPNFKVSVSIGGEVLAEGEGQSKKIAEMQSAGVALSKLKSRLVKSTPTGKTVNAAKTETIEPAKERKPFFKKKTFFKSSYIGSNKETK